MVSTIACLLSFFTDLLLLIDKVEIVFYTFKVTLHLKPIQNKNLGAGVSANGSACVLVEAPAQDPTSSQCRPWEAVLVAHMTGCFPPTWRLELGSGAPSCSSNLSHYRIGGLSCLSIIFFLKRTY